MVVPAVAENADGFEQGIALACARQQLRQQPHLGTHPPLATCPNHAVAARRKGKENLKWQTNSSQQRSSVSGSIAVALQRTHRRSRLDTMIKVEVLKSISLRAQTIATIQHEHASLVHNKIMKSPRSSQFEHTIFWVQTKRNLLFTPPMNVRIR